MKLALGPLWSIAVALLIHAKFEADLWIHPNQPGQREVSAAAVPVRVELPEGVAVWPTNVPGAKRLPLFGLRALPLAGLMLNIDGPRRLVRLEHTGA